MSAPCYQLPEYDFKSFCMADLRAFRLDAECVLERDVGPNLTSMMLARLAKINAEIAYRVHVKFNR